MALHVELENDGVAVLQRSLDGNKWLYAIILFRDARLFRSNDRKYCRRPEIKVGDDFKANIDSVHSINE